MCTFFVMSGYLCAIKPLQLIRAGNPDEARTLIARKAFRRYLCLGIPATVATFISWFMTQIGAFKLSTSLPGYIWLHFHSGYASATWGAAFRELRHAIVQSYIALLKVSCILLRMMVKRGVLEETITKGFNGLWQSLSMAR